MNDHSLEDCHLEQVTSSAHRKVIMPNGDTSTFHDGDLVEIQGLEHKPELNGTLGVVKKFHEDRGRYEVVPTRGKKTLAIKHGNLTQKSLITPNDKQKFAERRYQNVVFWPPVDDFSIPVQGFDDWPTNTNQEKSYLKSKFGWKAPTIVSGIESEGAAKPDFEMYFDVEDQVSSVNKIAQAIVALLPNYERAKVSGNQVLQPIRGACVLCYSPTASTFDNPFNLESVPGDGTVMISGNRDRLFSLQQMEKLLKFLHSKRARKQYKAHDNPIHRVFGGYA